MILQVTCTFSKTWRKLQKSPILFHSYGWHFPWSFHRFCRSAKIFMLSLKNTSHAQRISIHHCDPIRQGHIMGLLFFTARGWVHIATRLRIWQWLAAIREAWEPTFHVFKNPLIRDTSHRSHPDWWEGSPGSLLKGLSNMFLSQTVNVT